MMNEGNLSRQQDVQQHYAPLDGLRGLAALLVVITHLSTRTDLQDTLRIYGLGQVGVMLFFALSGFLMMHVTEGKDCKTHLRDFLVKRVARVYPLYAFVVLLAFGVGLISIGGRSLPIFGRIEDLGTVFAHLALLQGNGVLWTISVEIFFYFLFPLFWLAKDKGWPCFYVCLLLAFSVQQMAYSVGGWADVGPAFLGVIPRGHLFLLGMAVYPLARFIRDKSAAFDIYLLLATVLVVLNLQNVSKPLFGYSIYIWKNPAVLTCLAAMVLMVLSLRYLNVVFENSISRFLGEISYSIYLTHIFILQILRAVTGWHESDKVVYWVVCILLTIAFSYVTYRLVEQPCRRYLNELLCRPRLD